MNTLSCLIVDDEPLARKLLKGYIEALEDLVLAGECKNAIELKNFLEHQNADIIFLDINMPKLTGLEFVKSFRPEAKLVFTTAYPQYALDAFEVNASDYLVKPIALDRFLKCIANIKSDMNNTINEQASHIVIKENKRLYKLIADDICYVQAYGDYIKVITEAKTYVTKEKLSEFFKQLPSEFVQSHRSYVVNVRRVRYMEGNHVVVCDHTIPISAGYRTDFLDKFA